MYLQIKVVGKDEILAYYTRNIDFCKKKTVVFKLICKQEEKFMKMKKWAILLIVYQKNWKK